MSISETYICSCFPSHSERPDWSRHISLLLVPMGRDKHSVAVTTDGPHHTEAESQPQSCKNHAPSNTTVLLILWHNGGEVFEDTLSFLGKGSSIYFFSSLYFYFSSELMTMLFKESESPTWKWLWSQCDGAGCCHCLIEAEIALR